MSTTKNPTYKIKLLSKKEVAKNMLELTFERPADFQFIAGQFVQFPIPDGEKKLPRFYSICSCPDESNLRFCIKVVEGGKGSKFFSELEQGLEVEMLGPQGRFVATEENKPSIFIATGAGIAPIISIIEDQLVQKKNIEEIILLFGVRSQNDIFFVDYLEELAKHQNFSYHITLSRPAENSEWGGLTGRVTDHMEFHKNEHQVYLCGSPDMVKDVRKILTEKNMDMKKVHMEIF